MNEDTFQRACSKCCDDFQKRKKSRESTMKEEAMQNIFVGNIQDRI
jgi:hypothetical protein